MEIEPQPTAILCFAGDYVAVGVIQGLKTLGYRIPADVAVIGYDDLEYAQIIELWWFSGRTRLVFWVMPNSSEPQRDLIRIKQANLRIDGIKVEPLGYPGKNDWNVIHNLAPWIWGAGGAFLSPDYNHCWLNTRESLKGLRFYMDLALEGLVPIDCLELNSQQVEANFNNGRYATALFPKGRFQFLGGSNLGIFNSSKHHDQTWELIKYLVSPQKQIEYCKITGFMPALRAAYDDPYIAQDPRRGVLKRAITYGRS